MPDWLLILSTALGTLVAIVGLAAPVFRFLSRIIHRQDEHEDRLDRHDHILTDPHSDVSKASGGTLPDQVRENSKRLDDHADRLSGLERNDPPTG